MRKTLTQKTLDYLPPCTGKRYEIRDTLLPGFMLRVSKNGGKVWYLVTRVHGRQRRIKIGTYPILSLVDAREKARSILRDKQLGRLVESDGTLSTKRKPSLPEIVPQFIELYAKPRNREWKEAKALLGKFNVLGNRPIDEIKRPDVVAVLDGIMARGTLTGRIGPWPRSKSCFPGAWIAVCSISTPWPVSSHLQRKRPETGSLPTRNWPPVGRKPILRISHSGLFQTPDPDRSTPGRSIRHAMVRNRL